MNDVELVEAISERNLEMEEQFEKEELIHQFKRAKGIAYVVQYFWDEVDNGGLCQYFVNSSRFTAPYLLGSLKEIGAEKHASLFQKFIIENKIDLQNLDYFDIEDEEKGYIEFNAAVEKDGNRGWINIGFWEDVPFERIGKTVIFKTDFLEISFTGVGIEGSCPAEKDNIGCCFIKEEETALRKSEIIENTKEFCDCKFRWKFTDDDAHGVSIGKTLPAYPTEVKNIYPKEKFTVENAAKIPCNQVLGTYVVAFER